MYQSANNFRGFLNFHRRLSYLVLHVFQVALGLRSCARKFTKFNKVAITTLHFVNVPLSGYIKGYLRYKTVTSQNLSSKAQIKNFFNS